MGFFYKLVIAIYIPLNLNIPKDNKKFLMINAFLQKYSQRDIKHNFFSRSQVKTKERLSILG